MSASQKSGVLAIAMWAAASGMALAGPVKTTIQVPTLDRWMYAFDGSPGTRAEASIFGAPVMEGFDDRDAQQLIGWDTDGVAAPGLGADSYRVISVRVVGTISKGETFEYDATVDAWQTFLPPEDPAWVADADTGRPIELFGAGYRNGWSVDTFQEDSEFGGIPEIDPAEAARNVFCATFDSSGAASDVSRNVRQGFDPRPIAVGKTGAVATGEFVPQDTEFSFDVDLCDPTTRSYFRGALDSGRLNVVVTSIHDATPFGGGEITFPYFYHKEFPGAGEAGQTFRLEIVANQGKAADYNNDGRLNVNDFIAFQAAFVKREAGADFDFNCAFNVNDFIAFQRAFVRGE